jgi:Mlc titration factor MtfA (ptsG expression regulator)
MFGFKQRRRERLRKLPFPPGWLKIVKNNVPYFRLLPEEDRRELLGHVRVFLAEKRFEGCGGLRVTDEIRVTVAAQACLLLLHRKTGYYPLLQSILIYPHPYRARRVERNRDGLIREGDEIRGGESWRQGALVLAWDEVRRSAASVRDGHNVVLHEFAHQLDQEDGAADGAPRLPSRAMYAAWARVLGKEYDRLLDDLEGHRRTIIDRYGSTSPAEFFAVVTECFFGKPRALRRTHFRLYEQLRKFYRQDPAALVEGGGKNNQPPGRGDQVEGGG